MVLGSELSSGSFPDSNPLSLYIIYLWLECAGGNVHIALSSSSQRPSNHHRPAHADGSLYVLFLSLCM